MPVKPVVLAYERRWWALLITRNMELGVRSVYVLWSSWWGRALKKYVSGWKCCSISKWKRQHIGQLKRETINKKARVSFAVLWAIHSEMATGKLPGTLGPGQTLRFLIFSALENSRSTEAGNICFRRQISFCCFWVCCVAAGTLRVYCESLEEISSLAEVGIFKVNYPVIRTCWT